MLARTIRRDVTLPFPAALVWRAVSERALLSAWFMATDLEPEVGRAFTFRMAPQRGWDGVTYGEVLAVEPPRRLVVSYRSAATGEKAVACAGVQSEAAMQATKGLFAELDTVLELSVEEVGPREARLELVHSGFRGLKLVIVSFILGAGWGRVLTRLTPVLQAVERGETPPPRPS